MEQSKFSFNLNSTNPAAKLGFEAWINDQCVFDTDHVTESIVVTGILPNDNVETDHTLKMVLKNKLPEHTTISESGEISKDSCLTVSNLMFDNIALGQLVNKLTVYEHDFNGTQAITTQQFFGTMGCNGTVTLKFSTPIYLWMLENM
jgi:hypothetical protein